MESASARPDDQEYAAPSSGDGARLVVLADEPALVERVRAGDRTAFGAIFSAYGASLYSYAYRFTRSRPAAEELVHDVFARIWEKRRDWRVASVGAYLHGAVRRRALNYLRHQSTVDAWGLEQRVQVTADGAAYQESADDRLLVNDLAAAATKALDRLSPRMREAYLLHRQHHLSYSEIAMVLGVTPKAVEMQIGRALKALRALLAGYLAIMILIGR
ncbi:MAG TPA: sigma-70 family RNA polymerase sigma factor [Gemmatimonadaceae bacterium]|jgi:RNA polymerase sigma-70 factor (ECF subfamily)|nr:sigma-70 family RNA polymerase sigma factor [Gemmatimonadaceae bacterium]